VISAFSSSPIELSSKKPVPRLKSALPTPSLRATQPRDPRFDAMCGELNQKHFRASYGFIDELKQNEVERLRADLRKQKTPERREELQTVIARYVRAATP
jgi:ribosomal RNA-processing protein 36